MAVAAVDVPVFELGRGRQHIVGVVGGVGEEMLDDHGEQVFARKALHHLGRFGRHGHGVAVVDHDGFNARAESTAAGLEQRVAYGAHVDRARAARAQQPRHLQRRAPRRQRGR
ncbi:hypothetical protein D3C71_1426670 [compost metagenome]